jgi:hypothetical protein
MLKDRRIGRWPGAAAGFRSEWALLLGSLFFDFINVFAVQTANASKFFKATDRLPRNQRIESSELNQKLGALPEIADVYRQNRTAKIAPLWLGFKDNMLFG